jgi:hypothetical protein
VAEDARVSDLRNQAAGQSSGRVLAFVDADNEIGAGWAFSALEILARPDVGAVGAAYLAPLDGTWVQRSYGLLRGRPSGHHDVEWLGSGNLAVRRDAFENAGGFDTSLETCEDVDFCQRLRAGGWRIVSDARLRNVHYGDPKTLWDLFQGERWRGRDNVRVSLRRPLSKSSLPSAIVPVVDLLMLAVLLVGLLMLPVAFRPGLVVVMTALLVMAAGTTLRVARAVVRDRAIRGLAVVRLFVVVAVYDLARALALVTPAPHRGARATPAAATS